MKNNTGSNIGLLVTAGALVVGKVVTGKQIDILAVVLAGWVGSITGSVVQQGVEDIIDAIEEE